MFPSLVNCCTIDSFSAWPEEALFSVAKKFLGALETTSDVRSELGRACVHIHCKATDLAASVFERLGRHIYVTPKAYLDCIHLYLLVG